MKQRRETRRVIKGTGCFSIKFRLKNSDPIFLSLHSLFHQNLSNLGQEFQYCSTAACFVLIWDFDRKVKTTALHCGKLWGVTSTLIGVEDWVVGFTQHRSNKVLHTVHCAELCLLLQTARSAWGSRQPGILSYNFQNVLTWGLERFQMDFATRPDL